MSAENNKSGASKERKGPEPRLETVLRCGETADLLS